MRAARDRRIVAPDASLAASFVCVFAERCPTRSDTGTAARVWFTPPPGAVVPQPSRFRMALVMIAVVYGLVLSIGQVVAIALAGAPGPVRLLMTITIEVFLMTYVLMPRLTRWLARWIYPRKDIA